MKILLPTKVREWIINKAKKDPGPHFKGFMRRYFLFRSRYFSITINNIRRSDGTDMFHNHPYSYISLVLRGEYIEELVNKDRSVIFLTRSTGDVCYRHKSTLHRIHKAYGENGVWTLFIRWGDGQGEWGLFDRNFKYTPMNEKNDILNKRLINERH